MDQLAGFLLHPPLSEIGKKIGKMLKYTPTFKVLSAPLTHHIIAFGVMSTSNSGSIPFSIHEGPANRGDFIMVKNYWSNQLLYFTYAQFT